MPAGLAACDRDVMPTSTRTITADIVPRVVRFIRGLLTGPMELQCDGTRDNSYAARTSKSRIPLTCMVLPSRAEYMRAKRPCQGAAITRSTSTANRIDTEFKHFRHGTGDDSGKHSRLRLLHIRRRAGTGEEVLARRREDVDDLRVFDKPGLVLDAAGDDAKIAGSARAALAAEAEVHSSRDHPEHLLVRVAVGGGVGARLHRPPDDHFLLTDENAPADLVGDLLLG